MKLLGRESSLLANYSDGRELDGGAELRTEGVHGRGPRHCDGKPRDANVGNARTERPTPAMIGGPTGTICASSRRTLPRVTPWTRDFHYAAEFKKVDLAAVKQDIVKVLTTSQKEAPAHWQALRPPSGHFDWRGTARAPIG